MCQISVYALPCFLQVHYDPDIAGPRHLVDAVEGAGFEAALITGERLGACLLWVHRVRGAPPLHCCCC